MDLFSLDFSALDFWSLVDWLWQGFVALYVVLFALPLVPNAIRALSNNPNRLRPLGENNLTYDPSTYGFFTFMEPGRAKLIMRGSRFVRAIMYYAGRRWYGDAENTATPMDPEFWKVVRVELKDHPSHPIPFPLHWRKGWKWYVWWVYSPFSVLWWGWQRWVFLITGGVYTGLWPFQYVRVYPNEHFKRITKPDGEVALERIENYSDHFRVSDFQAPVRVPRADTQDKIPVSVLLNVIARITNPRDTAFNTDDQWSSRLLASVSSAVTNFSRSRALDIVLSAKDGDEARELATIIRDTTNEALTEIGIEVIRIEILDISVVDAAAAKLLGEEAIARVGKRAAILKAEGAAAGIYETGKAIAKYPEGIVSVNAEAMVRAATAANQNPGAITVLNTGGGSQGGMDANTAALIKEIRDARKRETEEPETPDSTKP